MKLLTLAGDARARDAPVGKRARAGRFPSLPGGATIARGWTAETMDGGGTCEERPAGSAREGAPALWVWLTAAGAMIGPLWWIAAILRSGRAPYDRWAGARVESP